MKFEVKNRLTGKVQFVAEVNCGEDAPHSIKLALAVRWGLGNETDLSETDLRWADLRETDLRWADLSGADLSGADLRGADLRETDLSGADLSWADLSGADLSGADLSETDLSGADLSGADLRWADLSWADLSWADLRETDLRETDLDFASWFLGCKSTAAKLDDRQFSQLLFHATRFDPVNLSGGCREAWELIREMGAANLFPEYRSDTQKTPEFDAPDNFRFAPPGFVKE